MLSKQWDDTMPLILQKQLVIILLNINGIYCQLRRLLLSSTII